LIIDENLKLLGRNTQIRLIELITLVPSQWSE
jgi:hypothetical protein